MKPTNDNFFIDSNVALYLLDNIESNKKRHAISLVSRIGFISPQVIFECLNVCRKKLKLDLKTALNFANFPFEILLPFIRK